MRSLAVFLILCSLMGTAMLIGASRARAVRQANTVARDPVPHIGAIQVLNGCGIDGCANTVADVLRGKGYDVKNIGNAPTWNYPFTIVVSKTGDTSRARQVAGILKTDKTVLMREPESAYEVVVIVGPDVRELKP